MNKSTYWSRCCKLEYLVPNWCRKETLRFTASILTWHFDMAFALGKICWFQLGKAGRFHRPVVFIGDDGHRRILNSWKFHLAVRHLFGGQSFQQSVRGLKSAMEALTVLFGSYFATKTHWFCTFTRENEPSVPSDSHFQLDNSVVFAGSGPEELVGKELD